MLQCAESGWLQSVNAALRIEIVGFLLTPQTNCFLLAVALAFGVLDCRVVFELYTGLKILSCLCALNLFYCNYVCGLPICQDFLKVSQFAMIEEQVRCTYFFMQQVFFEMDFCCVSIFSLYSSPFMLQYSVVAQFSLHTF